MSDALLPLNPATLAGGKIEDVEELIGALGTLVIRQRLQVAGATLAEIARVMNASPVGNEYALVVRPVVSVAADSDVTNVPSALANTQLLAANPLRKKACFVNLATNGILFLKLGAGATVTSCTVRILPGGYYETPDPQWQGEIDGFWTVADGDGVCITELT